MFLHTMYSPTGVSGTMNIAINGRNASADGLMVLHLASISGLSGNLNMFVSGEARAFTQINTYLHNTFEMSSGSLPLTVFTPPHFLDSKAGCHFLSSACSTQWQIALAIYCCTLKVKKHLTIGSALALWVSLCLRLRLLAQT